MGTGVFTGQVCGRECLDEREARVDGARVRACACLRSGVRTRVFTKWGERGCARADGKSEGTVCVLTRECGGGPACVYGASVRECVWARKRVGEGVCDRACLWSE